MFIVLRPTLMSPLQESIYCCRKDCKPRASYTHRLWPSLVWERCSSKAPGVHRIPHIALRSMLLNETFRPRKQRPHDAKALGIRVGLWERLLEALKNLSNRFLRNTQTISIYNYPYTSRERERERASESESRILSFECFFPPGMDSLPFA